MVRLLIITLVLIGFVSGCNQSSKKEQNVKIETDGIFNGITISYNDNVLNPLTDIGEYLLGSGPMRIPFKVRNNSLFPITSMNLTFEGQQNSWSFEKNEEGISKYPGKSGTCSNVLQPAEVCEIVIEFETNIKGFYTQDILFKYVNLVESAEKSITLSILAGNPASLLFENDTINYWFGEKTGVGQTPIVERDNVQIYKKNLKITNVGDLKARNIKLELVNSCSSKLTKTCPDGQVNAYTFTHNCPENLLHGESCEAKVSFKPLNQALLPELKHVTYNTRVKVDYEASMYKTPGSLNGYFLTVSTNIEAFFETSVDKVIYDNEILVGNRTYKTIRINNRGFRSGYLLKLIIKNPDDSEFAYCSAESGSTFLKCLKASDSSPLTQAEFSFRLNDKDNCLADASETKRLVEVDEGCIFEIHFQPSTEYETPMDFAFVVEAEFDSRWKDQEVIESNRLIDVEAKSLNAAKLVYSDFRYGTSTLPVITLPNGDLDIDLGRLALLSKNSFKYKKMSFKIKNVGGYPATNVVLRDGKDVIIPFKTDGVTTGISLGVGPYYYYKNVFITTDGCNEIQPSAACDVRLDFAPIHIGTGEENYANMFDIIDSTFINNSRKIFKVSYKSGALYQDSTLTASTPDFPESSSRFLISASLIMKAVLDDYTDPALGFASSLTNAFIGHYKYHFMTLKNIGTKAIPYLVYPKGIATKYNRPEFKLIPKPAWSELPSHQDCYPLLDFNYTSGETAQDITARLGRAPYQLDQDDQCVLTFQISTLPDNYTLDITKLFASPALSPGPAAFDKNPRWPASEWWNPEYRIMLWHDVFIDYADGDTSDPAGTGGVLQNDWGNYIAGTLLNLTIDLAAPAKIVPITPAPSTSAFIERPGFTAPAFTLSDGSTRDAVTIPLRRDYGPVMVPTTPYDTNIVRASDSVASVVVPSHIFDDSVDDYLFHGGTFESGKSHKMSFNLTNFGVSGGNNFLYSIENLDGDTAFSVSSLFVPNTHLATGSNPLFNVTFNPPVNALDPDERVYRARFHYSYLDGIYDNRFDGTRRRVDRSIMIVAVAKKSFPQLETYLVNVEVDPQDAVPPIETFSAPQNLVSSVNEEPIPVSDVVTLSTVKIGSRTALDAYARKVIVLRNAGTSDITNFSLIYRVSPTTITPITGTLPASIKREVHVCNVSDPLTDYDDITSCPIFSGTVLPATKEIRIIYTYKPGNSDSSSASTISAFYSVTSGQHAAKNVGVSFVPLDPAAVQLAEKEKKTIRIKVDGHSALVPSQAIDFGENIEMLDSPQSIIFDQPTGVRKILKFTTLSTTGRASFLKTYHTWKGITDKTAEPVYDGSGYGQIFQRDYSYGGPRIKIYAHRGCLVGDNNAPLARQQGFNASTSAANACFMKFHLYADQNYIGKKLDINNFDETTPNFVQLQYYNNERASFSYINVHFEGRLIPNRSIMHASITGDAMSYKKVSVLSNKTATFSILPATPRSSDVGTLVGYRVYYASNVTDFSDFTTAASAYKDFYDPPIEEDGSIKFTLTNLQISRKYFVKVAAIRYHSRYTRNSYAGLTGGKFLSEIMRGGGSTPWGTLKFMVPPIHMFYDYSLGALIDRDITTTSYKKFNEAKSVCTGEREDVYTASVPVKYSLSLITVPVWNVIVSRMAESNYDIFTRPHWLNSTTTTNFNTFFASYPSYNPSSQSGHVDEIFYFFYKPSGCGSGCTGQKAAGSSPLGRTNYNSLLDINFPGAHARCYLPIP